MSFRSRPVDSVSLPPDGAFDARAGRAVYQVLCLSRKEALEVMVHCGAKKKGSRRQMRANIEPERHDKSVIPGHYGMYNGGKVHQWILEEVDLLIL